MTLALKPRKRIGLVAHDNKKQDLIEWARYNRRLLAMHDLVGTGTTGTMLERELELPVTCLQSGPLGGDLQIGAMIADGSIDFLVFFWEPLEPQAHDTDVKSLLRIAVVWNIPVACDRYVPYDRDPQQRLHVRVVSLGFERLPEEDQEVDAAVGDHRPDLKVAAERSRL